MLFKILLNLITKDAMQLMMAEKDTFSFEDEETSNEKYHQETVAIWQFGGQVYGFVSVEQGYFKLPVCSLPFNHPNAATRML